MSVWAERLGLDGEEAQPLALAIADACRGRWSMVMAQRAGLTVSIGVAPLDSDPTCPGVAALLVITGSEASTSLPLQFFCQQHKLTPTEALVLAALNGGQAPGQIADEGRVAMTTVRTHIATIRAKVRAPSIRHLMRMLAALPPLMGAGARRAP